MLMAKVSSSGNGTKTHFVEEQDCCKVWHKVGKEMSWTFSYNQPISMLAGLSKRRKFIRMLECPKGRLCEILDSECYKKPRIVLFLSLGSCLCFSLHSALFSISTDKLFLPSAYCRRQLPQNIIGSWIYIEFTYPPGSRWVIETN